MSIQIMDAFSVQSINNMLYLESSTTLKTWVDRRIIFRFCLRRQILLMFVKLIFEDFEHFENRKRVTLTRPAIAGQLKTAIMKADGFTCTAPSHEHSRSAETY